MPRHYNAPKSVMKLLDDRWPDMLLTIPIAAARLSMSEYKFRAEPSLMALVRTVGGAEMVRPEDLRDWRNAAWEATGK